MLIYSQPPIYRDIFPPHFERPFSNQSREISGNLGKFYYYSIFGALNENLTTDIYQEFVKNLDKEDIIIIIISYNYDTLIDNAILYEFGQINYGFNFLTEEANFSEKHSTGMIFI